MGYNRYLKALRDDKKEPYYSLALEKIENFETKTYVKNAVVRWKNNDEIPSQEIMEIWKYKGLGFDFEKSVEQKKKEDEKFLEEYREKMKNYVPSREEIVEMQAAFGKGETVINALTGQTYKI